MTKPLPIASVFHQMFHHGRQGASAGLIAVLMLAGCATEGGPQYRSQAEIEAEARKPDVVLETKKKESEKASINPMASLSDLPPARLAMQTSHACLRAIETVAERYSGRRVMLGERAFVDSSEVVLDQVFATDAKGQVIDGRRTEPKPFVMQLRFGPNGCMVVVPAQSFAVKPVPASTPLQHCRCFPPAD